MKKFKPIALSFITASVLIMSCSLVFAEDTKAASSPATGSSMTPNPKNFQDHKAKILQHIQDRMTKIQQIQTCVQAAEDMKALRACKPHKDNEDHDKEAGK